MEGCFEDSDRKVRHDKTSLAATDPLPFYQVFLKHCTTPRKTHFNTDIKPNFSQNSHITQAHFNADINAFTTEKAPF